MQHPILIAGNAEQAHFWAEYLGLTHWRYIQSPDNLRGLREPEIFLVGEYWKNPCWGVGGLDYLRSMHADVRYADRSPALQSNGGTT